MVIPEQYVILDISTDISFPSSEKILALSPAELLNIAKDGSFRFLNRINSFFDGICKVIEHIFLYEEDYQP